jgi:hypothetical protein
MDPGGGPGICPHTKVSEINKMKEMYQILPPTLIYFKCSSTLTTKISKSCLNKFDLNFLDSFPINKSVSKFSAPTPQQKNPGGAHAIEPCRRIRSRMGIPYNHFYKDLTLSQVRE